VPDLERSPPGPSNALTPVLREDVGTATSAAIIAAAASAERDGKGEVGSAAHRRDALKRRMRSPVSDGNQEKS